MCRCCFGIVADSNLPEIPAGIVDDSGNFRGIAAESIQEECDIVINENELIDLTVSRRHLYDLRNTLWYLDLTRVLRGC